MTNAQQAGQIICTMVLSLIMTVHIVNELSEDFKNGLVVDLEFQVLSLCDLIGGVAVDILTSGHKVLLDARQGSVLPHIQMNDLVRDNRQALQ